MNRCNPHPNLLPEGEGIKMLKRILLLPLPMGEGWGEGYNHYRFNPLIRIMLRRDAYMPLLI